MPVPSGLQGGGASCGASSGALADHDFRAPAWLAALRFLGLTRFDGVHPLMRTCLCTLLAAASVLLVRQPQGSHATAQPE